MNQEGADKVSTGRTTETTQAGAGQVPLQKRGHVQTPTITASQTKSRKRPESRGTTQPSNRKRGGATSDLVAKTSKRWT